MLLSLANRHIFSFPGIMSPVVSPGKHDNACGVIESVDENLTFGIAMQHTGSFSYNTEIQVNFPSAEKGMQADEAKN